MSFWSKIFKSNDLSDSTKTEDSHNDVKLSDEERKKIKNKINQLSDQINNEKTGSPNSNKQNADLLTELGQNYQKLNNIDAAIKAYEKSLKCNEDFGPAFDGLLSLYDEKRKEAAYKKDNEEIQKWLNKSDELTALSKKIMRSK
jgi:tetratricopeptide (TPR) repeat protein